MQDTNSFFEDLIDDNLKVGDLKRPTYRVEVDRFMYIAGKSQEFVFDNYVTESYTEKVKIKSTQETTTGTYNANTKKDMYEPKFPVQGLDAKTATVTGFFGEKRGAKTHKGVDFPASSGTPVVSVWDGVVIKASAGDNGGYGNMVEIIHFFKYSRSISPLKTVYAHLSEINVSFGDTVTAGEVIGKVGNTGNVVSLGGGGYHLHFEIYENADGVTPVIEFSNYTSEYIKRIKQADILKQYSKGKLVDPIPYLNNLIQIPKTSELEGTGVVDGEEGDYESTKIEDIFYTTANLENNKSIASAWKNKKPIGKKNQLGKGDDILITPFNNFTSLAVFRTKNTEDLTFANHISNHIQGYPKETIDEILAGYNSVFKKGSRLTLSFINDELFDFKSKPKQVTGFTFNVDLDDNPGAFYLDYAAFPVKISGEGDKFNEIRVFAGTNLVARDIVTGNSNAYSVQALSAYLPKGTTKVKVEFVWGGYISIQYNFFNCGVRKLLPNGSRTGSKEVETVKTIVKNRVVKKEKIENFTVGKFVYMDTLTLDSVSSISIDNQYELSSNQATITINNANGFYTPDYNPFWFPELGKISPWSYNVNGIQIGVLSENTPIRIYLGYGNDLVRMFTGFIDKVDIQAGGTMSITCRDVYKKVIEKVLTEDKQYPEIGNNNPDTLPFWTKSGIVQDLLKVAGIYNWRNSPQDMDYADAVIEETYYISKNVEKGFYIMAVPGADGDFEKKPFSEVTKINSDSFKNPFVEEKGKKFEAYTTKIVDAINEVILDTGMRIYCDRYGTIRLESIDLEKPVVATYSENKNLMTLNKTIDLSRARSHILVVDKKGNSNNFMDDEFLIELKGEIRTLVIRADWAKTRELRKLVANHAFFEMKRLCRTLQVTIPMNPLLDPLDRIWVIDSQTSTRAVYTIKGIRTSFTDGGATQTLDLMWFVDVSEGVSV